MENCGQDVEFGQKYQDETITKIRTDLRHRNGLLHLLIDKG